MKLALLADIHGNAPALEAVLHYLKSDEVDTILCAGDMLGYYPFANEVIDHLRRLNSIAILGNHEKYLLELNTISPKMKEDYRLEEIYNTISGDNFSWIRNLPEKLELIFDGMRIILCHGSPWRYNEYIYPDSKNWGRFSKLGVDGVIMGHTHIPLIKKVGNVLLINPGSCGQPRDYQPGACYAVFDTQTKEVVFNRVSYDIDSLVDVLRRMRYPLYLIEILTRKKN